MTSRTSLTSRSSIPMGLEMMQNSVFQRAVDRAANFKCMQAIKAGKLRVVQQPNPVMPTRFTPRMDLIDDPSAPNLTAIFEVPGIKTSDLILQIRDGQLVILGERRAPQAAQDVMNRQSLPRNPITAADSVAAGEMDMDADTAHTAVTMPVHELRFGTFHRAIPVPVGIKESEVTAGLQDGMLTVTWPRSPVRSQGQSITPPVSPSAAGNAVL